MTVQLTPEEQKQVAKLKICPVHNEVAHAYCETCLHSLCYKCPDHNTPNYGHQSYVYTAEAGKIIRGCNEQIAALRAIEKSWLEEQMLSLTAELRKILCAFERQMHEALAGLLTRLIHSRNETSSTKERLESVLKSMIEAMRLPQTETVIVLKERFNVRPRDLFKPSLIDINVLHEGLKTACTQLISDYSDAISRLHQAIHDRGDVLMKTPQGAAVKEGEGVGTLRQSHPIVQKEEEAQQLCLWTTEAMNHPVMFEPLWQSSQHGLDVSTFHRLCDAKGPTLTIIRSGNGKLFGGFAFVSWKSSGGWHNDPRAFVYSLDSKMKHATQTNKYSLAHYKTWGPTFGWNKARCDITVRDKGEGLSWGDCTFSLPQGTDLQKYYAGSRSFKIAEIAVYSVLTHHKP